MPRPQAASGSATGPPGPPQSVPQSVRGDGSDSTESSPTRAGGSGINGGASDHARGSSDSLSLASALSQALAARAVLGMHDPVDELVVGPLRESDIQVLVAECTLAPSRAAQADSEDTQWQDVSDSGSARSDSKLSQAAALKCMQQQLQAVEEVALQAGLGGVQAAGTGTGTNPGSLRHRRPILVTHVHLGDVVHLCPLLSTDGQWVRDQQGEVHDRWVPFFKSWDIQ
jgi:hypothetical protein